MNKTRQLTEAQTALLMMGAKHDNDLTRLLRPYYSFRLFILFTKPFFDTRTGQRKQTVHRYGFENECSYNQCVSGYFKEIVLNKKSGFELCVWMAEEKHKGAFRRAQIYTRSETPGGNFDVLLREYDHHGELVKNDHELISHLIQPDQNKILYFDVDASGFIHLRDEPKEAMPTAEEFASLVHQSLNP